MSTATGSTEELLAAWLPEQRWYPAKGLAVVVQLVGGFDLPGGSPAATATVHLVRLTLADGTEQLVQVPLVARADVAPELAHAHLGTVRTTAGSVEVYDGPHDPAYVDALVDQLAGGGEAVSGAGSAAGWARGVAGPDARLLPPPGSPATVLSGEQSNTSVVVRPESGTPAIVKVFRTLHAGENPDIVLQSVLTGAGSRRVAGVLGWVEGGWVGADGAEVLAHLAFAAEFLPGSEDAWRVATRAVAGTEDFSGPARDLGAATAEVHAVLAEHLPSLPATPARLGGLAEHLGQRGRWATDAVGDLAPYADAVATAANAVRQVLRAPDWQRIHGDYHLGQVLRPAERGWVLLDFEGEPLRPLAERSEPDCPLRDVAGMLRSFDYAARHATVGLGPDDPRVAAADAWARAARDAFCTGYGDRSGRDPREDDVLLRALELDKALYEVVYEARNRPSWLGIPLGAVQRLLG